MSLQVPAEAVELFSKIEEIDLERYRVVGDYARFDVNVRNNLKDFRLTVDSSVRIEKSGLESFLLWGAPGSGKSFLVSQIAANMGSEVAYVELNLAAKSEHDFREGLTMAEKSDKPAICFIDEVDSKPNEHWPYEVLIPYMEPSRRTDHRIVYILAGSSGANIDEMKNTIAKRNKGVDLLSRIPRRNEYTVPPLSTGDKIVVAVSQMMRACSERNKAVKEVEKAAIVYLAVNPNLSSARQLRSLAVSCANRMPAGEDRVKYDYLFAPGDVESKDFWMTLKQTAPQLVTGYVEVVGDSKSNSQNRGEQGKERRIAVLPLTNMSPDPQEGYFADGMTEELITSLSTVRQLTVISRTSVMGYKGTTKNAKEIGRELGVGYLLEGSVRKAGNRVRITAQLIDASTDSHLWANNYDRNLDDVFSIQSEIAEKVVEELKIRLLEDERKMISKKATENSDAYIMYLRGRQLLNEGDELSVRRALAIFEQAVALDSSFAKGFSGVAMCHLTLANNGYEPVGESLEKAEPMVEKAIHLDPELAEAHATFAYISFLKDDVEKGEAEAKRAIELNPSLPDPYWELSTIYMFKGEVSEAIKAAEESFRLDPMSPRTVSRLGLLYFYAGRENDALSHWNKTVNLAPSRTYGYMVEYHLYKGQIKEAERCIMMAEKLDPANPLTLYHRGLIAAYSGDKEKAMNVIAEMKAKPSVDALLNFIAIIYYALGDADSFFEYINDAADRHSVYAEMIMYSPLLANARNDPRYHLLLAKMGR
ncbi:MAG: AAA family ATPase [Thermoprotei archaeon]